MTTIPEVDENSIGVLTPLGGGGEGEVFRISSDKTSVYKKFHSHVLPEINEPGLRNTIECLDEFSPQDRSFILTHTAWPHTIVRSGRQLSGFLMPLVNQKFFSRQGRKDDKTKSPTDWNRLAYLKRTHSQSNIVTTLPDMHVEECRLDRINLCRDLAAVFMGLHEHDIVVGDVSGRNILWSQPPDNRVLLIDCDGMRKEGQVAVTRAKQSPDWFDPILNGDTNLESDRYKLSLAIFRGYFGAESTLPKDFAPAKLTESDIEVLELSKRSTSSVQSRPTAAEWLVLLSDLLAKEEELIRFQGRPGLDWRSDLPTHNPTVPAAPSPDRPQIDWRSP